ncbi:MAG: ATP-binding protein [Lysobacter sp.]
MSDNDRPDEIRPWSDDLLTVLSLADIAIVLIHPASGAAQANTAAHTLAQALQAPVPGSAITSPPAPHTGADPAPDAIERILGHIPEGAWELARRDGRWVGEVRLDVPPALLQIKLFSEHGGGLRRFATFVDVTARSAREAELQCRHDELQTTYEQLAGTQEQLLQSEKMASIGQLAAGVAHEINNPVGYVHSNLGTLQEYVSSLLALLDAYAEALQDEDPASQRESLQAMRLRLDIDFITGDVPQLLVESREGIERVTKIVQDLKDFSRIGPDEPMRPSDVQKGLESTLNIVWNDLKYKVTVEKYYGLLPLVECHASEINQVLMNLLINAGQAIHERGVLVLATGADDGEVWISISDSGCGMPDEVLQRIFDPFYTTKPIGRGTGLGLAIGYSIIAKHHGRIEVSSRLGIGSTFRVVLPVSQPNPPQRAGVPA